METKRVLTRTAFFSEARLPKTSGVIFPIFTVKVDSLPQQEAKAENPGTGVPVDADFLKNNKVIRTEFTKEAVRTVEFAQEPSACLMM